MSTAEVERSCDVLYDTVVWEVQCVASKCVVGER
jgi:hypothetical protein